jgi:hypothetical protein
VLPDHAGGGDNILVRVDALLTQQIAPWRIAVLMDSDRLVPGNLPPKVAKKEATLKNLGIKTSVWFKREIENYLSPSLLPTQNRYSNVRRSYFTLTREQQDHYDMKLGFELTSTGDVVVPKEQQGLFKDVPDWHKQHLCGGFGKSAGDTFKGATIDHEEMALVCSTYPNEIEEILRSLEEML